MTIESTIGGAVATATAAAARMMGGTERRTVVLSEPERALDAPETGVSRHSGRTVQAWHHDTLADATADADKRAAVSLVRASFAVVTDSTGFLVIPQWSTKVDDRLYSTGN